MIAVAFIAIPLIVSMSRNSYHWTSRMLRANSATRRALYPEAERAKVPEGIKALRYLRDPVKLEAGLAGARNSSPVRGLLELDELSLAQKRKTAVFVPQSEERYWNILGRPGACAFSGFLVPALTGMAMIDGMPAVGCKLSPYYGLSLFRERKRAQAPADTDPAQLCRRAVRLGFERVMTLRFDQNGRLDRQSTECLKK